MPIINGGLDNNALKQMLTSPAGKLYKDLLRRGIKVESAAKKNLSGDGGEHPKRVDTGRLRASIVAVMVTVDGYPAAQVGTNVEYALLVHNGTGIYGPENKLIRPVGAKALRWKTKTATGRLKKKKGLQVYTFSMSSKGMQPNPFLADALSAAKD